MMKISEREKREREIDLHGPRDWSCPKQKAESVSNCSTISMGTFQLIISCARFNINSTSYFAPRPAPPLFFHEQAYPEWVQHMLIALHAKYLTRLNNLGSSESARKKLEDRATWKAALFRNSLLIKDGWGPASCIGTYGRIVREPPVSRGRGLLVQ